MRRNHRKRNKAIWRLSTSFVGRGYDCPALLTIQPMGLTTCGQVNGYQHDAWIAMNVDYYPEELYILSMVLLVRYKVAFIKSEKSLESGSG